MKELKIKNTFKKSAIFTDSHWGRKQNSEIHNNDCLDFVKFFCKSVKLDKTIDHIVFMGDWFDHRSAINISTLNYSYKGMSLLNDLNIPVFYIIGNHDLYLRNNRDIHSLIYVNEFKNFTLIDEPTKLNDLLFLPYIFEEEYNTLLSDINLANIIYGHLELKGFILTGDTIILEHGPDHTDFKGPKRILTGHFHKRQSKDNVTYIGNTMPLDFSDTNDVDRGFATYEYSTDKLDFFNWKECPSYIKCSLSDLMVNHKTILKEKASVKCLLDIEVTLEESIELRDKFIKKYNLRELFLEEKSDEMSIDSDDISLEGMELETTNNIIKKLLEKVDVESIDKNKLIKIYEEL